MANELTTAEMLNSKVVGDKQESFRSQNNPSNRDINGSSDDRNSVKNTTNENKPPQNKKPTANGDIKPPSSLPAELKKEKSALKTPTRKISPKTPETGSTNSLGEKKKVPMNKIQVGAAPSPNLKVVRSKIGSLENYSHKPGGGKVKIENRKLEWNAQPRIEAKNDKYAPSGGEKKITQVKLQWSAKSKIGSLENATHKPGGGDKKIETVKLDFKDKAKPKVGSKDNIKHVAGGGTVKKSTDADTKSISSDIEDQKLEIKAQSKIGSLDNVKHRPGGGDKKIFDDKEYLKQMTLTNESSKANSVTTSGSQALEDSQLCSREAPKNEKPVKPITPAATDSPAKKPDKAKEQIKTKVEQSPNKEKKSEPNTPKKSLAAKKESPDKPTPDIKPTVSVDVKNNAKPVVEKSSPKLDKKSEKAESKLETDLVNEKSHAKAAPMQLKLDSVKGPIKENSKGEINPKNKIKFDQKPDQLESQLDTNKSTQNTDSKNLPEINKPKPGDLENEKTKTKSENLNKEINVSQGAYKPVSIPASKDSTEKSNLRTADKEDSKIKVDNKSNQPISDKEQKKESNNSPARLKRNTNNGNKSNLVPSEINDQTKLSNPDTKPLAKNSAPFNDQEQNKISIQNVKPKEENKSNLGSTVKEPPSKALNNQDLKHNDESKSNISTNPIKPVMSNVASTSDNKPQLTQPFKTEKEAIKVLNTQDVKSNLGNSTKSHTQQMTEISTKPKPNTEVKTGKDEKIITFSSTDVKCDQNGNKSDPKIINIPIAKQPSLLTGKIGTQENSSKERGITSSAPKAISTEFKPLESTIKEIKTQINSNESPSRKQQILSGVTLNQELKK